MRRSGEAEAAAIAAKGQAEAAAILAAADAYERYGEAAKLQAVLDILPDLAGKLVEPYASVDNISIVSSDGESKLARNAAVGLEEALSMLGQFPQAKSMLDSFVKGGGTGSTEA